MPRFKEAIWVEDAARDRMMRELGHSIKIGIITPEFKTLFKEVSDAVEVIAPNPANKGRSRNVRSNNEFWTVCLQYDERSGGRKCCSSL